MISSSRVRDPAKPAADGLCKAGIAMRPLALPSWVLSLVMIKGIDNKESSLSDPAGLSEQHSQALKSGKL